MKDINIAYNSNRNCPAGASLWAFTAGHLTGGGSSHYISRPDYVCPHIIVKGKGTVKTCHGSMKLGVGDMFCLLPGTQVEYYEDPANSWEFYWLHLTGNNDLSFAMDCGFDINCPWFRPGHPEPVIECFQKIHNHFTIAEDIKPYYVISLLYQIADLCIPKKYPSVKEHNIHLELVNHARLLINAQLHTGINVSELASLLNVNRSTLFHAFQKVLNTSPVKYLRNARIKRAKQLLRETHFTLDLIAKSSGFTNSKYFFKTFKEFEKMGPTSWRRQH